jgi:TolA-binding protein
MTNRQSVISRFSLGAIKTPGTEGTLHDNDASSVKSRVLNVETEAQRSQKPEGGSRMIIRRTIASVVMSCVLFLVCPECSHAQTAAPKTNVDAKQQDKMLFERAMAAMKNSKYGVARTLLETLINSHPDSEYVPRAKLSIGDAWYAEGIFKQAEAEYRDFITFFPNRPEVAETKLKIDSIQKKARM